MMNVSRNDDGKRAKLEADLRASAIYLENCRRDVDSARHSQSSSQVVRSLFEDYNSPHVETTSRPVFDGMLDIAQAEYEYRKKLLEPYRQADELKRQADERNKRLQDAADESRRRDFDTTVSSKRSVSPSQRSKFLAKRDKRPRQIAWSVEEPLHKQGRDWIPPNLLSDPAQWTPHVRHHMSEKSFLDKVRANPRDALGDAILCGAKPELEEAIKGVFDRARYKMMKSAFNHWDRQLAEQFAQARPFSVKSDTQVEQRIGKGPAPIGPHPDVTPRVERWDAWLRQRSSIHLDNFPNKYVFHRYRTIRPLLPNQNVWAQLAEKIFWRSSRDHRLAEHSRESVQMPLLDSERPPSSMVERMDPSKPYIGDIPYKWAHEFGDEYAWFPEVMKSFKHPASMADVESPDFVYFDPIHTFETCEPSAIGTDYPAWLFVGETGRFYQQFAQVQLLGQLILIRLCGQFDLAQLRAIQLSSAVGEYVSRFMHMSDSAKEQYQIAFLAKVRYLAEVGEHEERKTQNKKKCPEDVRTQRANLWQALNEDEERLYRLRSEYCAVKFRRLQTTLGRLADSVAFLLAIRGLLDDSRATGEGARGHFEQQRLHRELPAALRDYCSFDAEIDLSHYIAGHKIWPTRAPRPAIPSALSAMPKKPVPMTLPKRQEKKQGE